MARRRGSRRYACTFHGSIATLMSFAMALRYSFDLPGEADLLEKAVAKVLEQGLRTGDIMQPGKTKVGTKEMSEAVLKSLDAVAG